MKLKICAIIGLIFLILNQILLLQGNEFIQTQKSVDYVHWLLLLGVLLSLSLNYIFSDGIFNNTATVLTSIGIIALTGQAVIDFLWWSYGTDYEGMNELTNQIMKRPSIRIPFITIGPALFYLGLATHAGKFIRKFIFWSSMAILGVVTTGLGSFVFDSREIIIWGHIVLAVGIIGLIIKKDTDKLNHKLTELEK